MDFRHVFCLTCETKRFQPKQKNMQHIGELVEKEVAKSGMTPPTFADLVNMTPVGFRKIFGKSTIQAELIESISKALGINLFRILADNFDRDHETGNQLNEPVATYRKSGSNGTISEGKFSLNIEVPEEKRSELIKLIFDK